MSETRFGIELSLRDRATAELRVFEEQLKSINGQIRALIASSGELSSISAATRANLAGGIAPLEAQAAAIRQQMLGVKAAVAEANMQELLGGNAGGGQVLRGWGEEKATLQELRGEAVALGTELDRVRATGMSTNIRFRYEGIAGVERALSGVNARLIEQTALVQRLNTSFGAAPAITRLGPDVEALALQHRAISSARTSASTFERDLPTNAMWDDERRQAAQLANQKTELGHQFDAETASMSRAAQEQAQILSQMNRQFAEHYSQQEAIQKEGFKFQEDLAPSSRVRYDTDDTGAVHTIDVGEEEARARYDAAHKRDLIEIDRLGREAADAKRAFAATDEEAAVRASAAASLQQQTYRQMINEAQEYQLQLARSQRLFGQSVAPLAKPSGDVAEWRNMVLGSLNEVPSSADRAEQALHRAGAAFDSIRSGATSAGAGINVATYEVRKFITEFDEMMRGQRGQMISTIGSAIRDLGTAGLSAVKFIAPLAAGLGLLEVGRIVGRFGELAEKTQNAAAAAGMGVQQYSQLQRTLQLISGDSERLNTVFGTMSQSIEEALTSPASTKGSAWAQILGPDWDEQLRKAPQDFGAFIDTLRQKFQQLGTNLETVELFRRATGRGWQELGPILRQTDSEWSRLNATAQASGSVMTGPEAEALAKVSESSKALSEDLAGLGKEFALLGANTGAVDMLGSFVLKLQSGLQTVVDFTAHVKALAAAFTSLPRIVSEAITGTSLDDAQKRFDARAKEIETNRQNARRGGDFGPPGQAFGPPLPYGFVTPIPPRVAPPTPQQREQPALVSPYFDAEKLSQEMTRRIQVIRQGTEIQEAQYRKDIAEAEAHNDRPRIRQLETARTAYLEQQNRAAQAEAAPYIARVQREGGPADRPLVEQMQGATTELKKEQLDTETQAITKNTQLRNQDYQDFAAGEREKIASAQGNLAVIEGIYEQWLGAIVGIYGQDEKEFDRVQREHVQAATAGTTKLLEDQLRIADARERANAVQLRLTSAGFEAKELGRGVGRVDHSAEIQTEMGMIQQSATQEIQTYQDIAQAAQDNSQIKIDALDRALAAAENAANQEMELAKKVAEENKKQLAESSRAYVQFFDSAESGFERFFETELTGSAQQRAGAVKELIGGLEKDVLHTTFSIGSQLAGQGLAKATGQSLEPGKGVGDLLGNMVGRLVGLSKPEDKEALAQNIAQQSLELDKVADGVRKQILAALTKQTSQTNQIQSGTGMPLTPMPGGYSSDRALDLIEKYESGGRNVYNQQGSGASGYYQITRGTWREEAPKVGVSTSQYPEAINAPAGAQRRVAGELYQERGFSPWADYNPQLKSALNRGEGGFGPQAGSPGGVQDVNIVSVAGSNLSAGPLGSLPISNPLSTTGSNPPPIVMGQNPVGGSPLGYQEGGMPKPPMGSSDSMLAWLTPGEFVVTAPAVQHYGTGMLHGINSFSHPKGYQDGGEVGDPEADFGQIASQGPANIGRGMVDFLSPAASSYLSSENQMLSGDMSRGELAGFVGQHLGGGAPGDSLSAGLRFARMETTPGLTLSDERSGIQRHALYAAGRDDPVASALISQKGSRANVELIRSYLPAEYPTLEGGFARGMGPGTLGPKFVRDAARAYFEANPHIDELSGLRVSGAREKARTDFAIDPTRADAESFLNRDDYATIYRNMVLKEEKPEGFESGGNVIPFPGRLGPNIEPSLGDLQDKISSAEKMGDWENQRLYQQQLDALKGLWKIPGHQSGGEVLGGHGTPTITTSGGFTTETRGFTGSYLQPVYPKTPHWEYLALAGIGALGVAGAAASLFGKKDQSDALNAAPTDTSKLSDISQSTSALSQSQADAAQGWTIPQGWTDNSSSSSSDLPIQTGGSASPASYSESEGMTTYPGSTPGFAQGGITDTIHAKLTPGERVLNLKETDKYHKAFPHGILNSYAAGGVVWPGFADGGVAGGLDNPGVGGSDPSLAASPSSSSGSQASTALGAVQNLTGSMAALGSDVDKVSSGFTSLERGASQASSAISPLGSAFKSVTTAAGSLNSVFSAFQNIKGAVSTVSSVTQTAGQVGQVAGQAALVGAITAGATATSTAIITGVATIISVMGAQATITDGILTAILAKPSVLGTTLASGGIVGAAGGMMTEAFTPSGTDTVPAMLTPGERVLNLSETAAYHSSFPKGILHAQGGALVGGLPHFASGGVQLPSISTGAISSFVQHAASSAIGGGVSPASAGGDTHNHYWNFNGMLDSHGARNLLMKEFGSIAQGFQRASRNNYNLPK